MAKAVRITEKNVADIKRLVDMDPLEAELYINYYFVLGGPVEWMLVPESTFWKHFAFVTTEQDTLTEVESI
jgi:hypothetical protein